MGFDLDAIVNKERTIRYNGRDVIIKNLNMNEYLLAEFEAGNVDDIAADPDSKPEEVIDKMVKKMTNYIMMVLDVTEDEAMGMEYRQFRHLREYLSELDLQDQGFSPKEIDAMKKHAAKKRVEQALIDSSL